MMDDCQLRQICQFENNMPEHLKEEFEEIKAALQKEKSEWLEKKVLYTALQSVLKDIRLKKCEDSSNLFETIDKTVLLTEVKYCGLTYCAFEKDDTLNIDDGTSKVLASSIENKLLQICQSVLEYHDGMFLLQHSDNQLQTARSIKLGEIIKVKMKKLEMCCQEFSNARIIEKLSLATCLKELLVACDYISKILKKYVVEIQPRLSHENCTNFLSRCETLGLKSTSMIGKLQKELYASESIVALQSIRTELVKNKHRKHQETDVIEQQLQGFQRLGSDFTAIVNEYNQLQADIDKRKWALDELQQR